MKHAFAGIGGLVLQQQMEGQALLAQVASSVHALLSRVEATVNAGATNAHAQEALTLTRELNEKVEDLSVEFAYLERTSYEAWKTRLTNVSAEVIRITALVDDHLVQARPWLTPVVLVAAAAFVGAGFWWWRSR